VLEGLKGGRLVEGARRPDLGVEGADFAAGILPVLLRVFETGNAGRAMLGGPFDGRDGRGSVVAMVQADEV
jgi:hypothetical protein